MGKMLYWYCEQRSMGRWFKTDDSRLEPDMEKFLRVDAQRALANAN